MSRPTRPLLLVLLCSGLAAQSAAQSTAPQPAVPQPAARATIAGRVVTANGEPWGGATVILSAHTTPCAPELGTVDRVEVTASDSGIFRAQVLTDFGYSVRALQSQQDGSTRRSDTRHGAVPGALVSLQEIDPQPAFRVHVRTDPAWADLAPFALRILFPNPNLDPPARGPQHLLHRTPRPAHRQRGPTLADLWHDRRGRPRGRHERGAAQLRASRRNRGK